MLYGLTFDGTIASSPDNGYNWQPIAGLNEKNSISEIQLGYTGAGKPVLFGSTYNYGIIKHQIDLSSVKTAFNQDEVDFELIQNFPNPFNPATVITYKLKNPGFVSLKVYDALGREVARLVEQYQSNGTYETKFDGSNLSSGIYLCRINVNDKISRRLNYTGLIKMLLLK